MICLGCWSRAWHGTRVVEVVIAMVTLWRAHPGPGLHCAHTAHLRQSQRGEAHAKIISRDGAGASQSLPTQLQRREISDCMDVAHASRQEDSLKAAYQLGLL